MKILEIQAYTLHLLGFMSVKYTETNTPVYFAIIWCLVLETADNSAPVVPSGILSFISCYMLGIKNNEMGSLFVVS